VLVSHFGLNPDEQENAVQTVIENLPEEKCVLLGDFNMRPEKEILNPIRARMYDTAELFGEPKFSFPSDHPDRKIDYIFTSRDLPVLSADIPAIVSSDHRPHIATVEIR
jgi:endonuclease/exonuclease/phosphatase family metal-dependent hydrolase